jgi:hypothetical protein
MEPQVAACSLKYTSGIKRDIYNDGLKGPSTVENKTAAEKDNPRYYSAEESHIDSV